MAIDVAGKVIALCTFSIILSFPIAANDDLTSDLLSEDLLDEGFGDSDLFEEEEFSQESLIVDQNTPLQLSVEHSLALNPKVGFQRTNHITDLRLSTEGSIGLLGYAQLEMKALQFWQGDQNKPAKSDFSLLEIEQLELQYSLAQTSVKLGRYILSWGEVEGSGVLDVINPAPNPVSGANGFSAQWLLSGRYYMPSAQVSGFVGLDPSVAHLPGVALTTPIAKEWGLRYGHTGEGSDWAVYVGHMVPNSPVLNLSTATASAKAYQLVGYSWNQAINDDLVKFDLAYKRGLQHNLGYTGLTTDNRIDAAVGLELNDGDRQWNASLTAQHWLNYRPSYLSPGLPPVTSNRTDSTYSIGVSDSFKNEAYSWSLMLFGTPNGTLSSLASGLTWQPTDQWQSSLSFATMRAKSSSAYAMLDGTQRLTLKAKFTY